MKKIGLSLCMATIICLFINAKTAYARIDHNPNGSVTITGKDIGDRMRKSSNQVSGPNYDIYNNPSYTLTRYQDGYRSESIWMDDRLSTDDYFKFYGEVEISNPNIFKPFHDGIMGDGMSLIFHNDDKKMVGQIGSSLGVLGLANAHGLVIDTFANNANAGDTFKPGGVNGAWQNPNKDKHDPISSNEYYFQTWSTNSSGQGMRGDKVSRFKKKATIEDKKEIEVDYNPNSRYLTFKVQNGNQYTEHSSFVPRDQKYFYFSSTASTGDATGTHTTRIKQITYMPSRFKRLVYRDVETGNEIRNPEIITGKLNDKYEFKPNLPSGYDVLSIEGKLSGKFEYGENFDHETVTMHLRKQPTSSSYRLRDNNAIKRNDETNHLGIEGSKLNITQLNKPISKITFTTPTYVEWDLKNAKKYEGWRTVDYKTKTKNVYQVYNYNHYNNPLPNGVTNQSIMQEMIRNYGQFTFEAGKQNEIRQDLITLELSNDAVVIHEDTSELGKTGYFMPYLYDQNFKRINTKSYSTIHPLVEYNSSRYRYKGINSTITKQANDNELFVQRMLDDSYIATSDGQIKGRNASSTEPSYLDKYLIKFNLKNVFEGIPETADPAVSMPQPVYLTAKDTNGRIIKARHLVSKNSYNINDTIFNRSSDLPEIKKYTFVKMDKSSDNFPIKVTPAKRELVAIYESNYNYWGTVPWDFDNKSGILTLRGNEVNDPVLGSFSTSPWNRQDDQVIDATTVKKIELVGNIKAPKDSEYLFSNGRTSGKYLTNLENITNLYKLDMSNVTNTKHMFYNVKKMTVLDLSEWNTNLMTNMSNMFENMTDLKELRLGQKTRLLNGTGLNNPTSSRYSGNWQTIGSGTPDKPRGIWRGKATDLEKRTQKTDRIKDTYVWQPLLVWGNVPWTFDDTGLLTFHGDEVKAPLISGFTSSPWNRRDSDVLDAEKIKKIALDGSIQAPYDSEYLFSNARPDGKYLINLEEIQNLEKLDVSLATNMDNMFYKVAKMSSLDLSQWNTNKVKKMTNMFKDMPILKELKLGDQTKLMTGTSLTNPSGSAYGKKWQTVGKGTSENPKGNWMGTSLELEKKTQVSSNKAETYVWQPLLVWGNVPWTFDETGLLILHGDEVSGPYLNDFTSSPWNRRDNKKIYAAEVKKIKLVGNISAPYDAQYLFSNSKPEEQYLINLEEIENLKNLDVSSSTEFKHMFYKNKNIENLDLSTWNTSKAKNMTDMFGDMSNLRELQLGSKTKLLTGTNLTKPVGTKYTNEWQTVGKGTKDNPKGNWWGTPEALEKRTQGAAKKEDTYVWQPLVGDIYLAKYPDKYKFETKLKDNWQPVTLEPQDKNEKYLSVSDERRVTSSWSLNVAAQPLISKESNKQIEEALFEFDTESVIFKKNNKVKESNKKLNHTKHVSLFTDNTSFPVMNLGELGEEPPNGEYGLSISDMKLKVPRNRLSGTEEFYSHLCWTLDAVPEFE